LTVALLVLCHNSRTKYIINTNVNRWYVKGTRLEIKPSLTDLTADKIPQLFS